MLQIRRIILFRPHFPRFFSNLTDNDTAVGSEFVNRNPRNLEKLNFAQKPEGWDLDDIPTNYWHRVVLDLTGRHTTGRIVHFEGNTVLLASTKEWAIKKFLHSTNDVAASSNIGRVLARRCLEAGLLYANHYFTKADQASGKVKAFLEALEEGGLHLREPDVIPPETPYNMPRDCPPLWPTKSMNEEYEEKFSSLIYTRKYTLATKK